MHYWVALFIFAVTVLGLLYWFGVLTLLWIRLVAMLRADFAKGNCHICGQTDELEECPCGKEVCGDCEDRTIYSDVVLCRDCAHEVRQGWEKCDGHTPGEPYVNDDGDTIAECTKCDYPQLIAKAEEV